jgi:hypothetical protein
VDPRVNFSFRATCCRSPTSAIRIVRYAFRPAAVSIRPMRVYFNCFVCKAGKLDDDFKKLFNFIHQQHARRKRIRLLGCRHQALGPLPVEWTPTLAPEHVTCKPFSDTPNPYGMRRRNKGNYEPYNTNNGENHCYSGEIRHPLGALDEPLAKDRSYVMGFDSETPLTPMSATASRPRFFAFMMCSQSKMVSGAG